MEHGVSIRDICIKFNPQALHIDERKLVKFGLIHGIIRRVFQYPVYDPVLEESHYTPTRQNVLYKLCNGTHHFDEICCKLNCTNKELTEKIERDPNISVICK